MSQKRIPLTNPPTIKAANNNSSSIIKRTTNNPSIPATPLTSTTTAVHCPKGTHNVITLGCVKNHLTRQEAFGLGCKMGFHDNPDQEAYIATGGFKNHSTAFTQGYNLAFGNGKDPSACKPYMN